MWERFKFIMVDGMISIFLKEHRNAANALLCYNNKLLPMTTDAAQF